MTARELTERLEDELLERGYIQPVHVITTVVEHGREGFLVYSGNNIACCDAETKDSPYMIARAWAPTDAEKAEDAIKELV